MDTIIDEIVNDVSLWAAAIVGLTLDGYNMWYSLVLNRYDYLKQKQEEAQKAKDDEME